MQDYNRIQAWERAHALALGVYRATAAFPRTEQFGLTAQLRRAALSAPTNIAEGSKRSGPRAYGHFLNIAEGSLAETDY